MHGWSRMLGGVSRRHMHKDCLNRYILLFWPSPLVSLNDIESAQKFMSSIKILKLTRRNGNTGYRRKSLWLVIDTYKVLILVIKI
jgi:hypothetical protein